VKGILDVSAATLAVSGLDTGGPGKDGVRLAALEVASSLELDNIAPNKERPTATENRLDFICFFMTNGFCCFTSFYVAITIHLYLQK